MHSKIELLTANIDQVRLPTLCDGYAGICWLFRNLHKEGFIDSDDIDETIEDIDRYIYNMFCKYYIHDIDYLHGGAGIAMYFLLSETKYGLSACNLYLDKLDETKITIENGSYMWKTEVDINGENEIVVNLGLSHGMASIVIFLAEYYERTKDSKAKRLLQQSIKYYINNTNPESFYSVYSNWIKIDDSSLLSESRLAWCYGDLGIAVALNRASLSLTDKNLFDFSTKILEKTTRRQYNNTQIKDASFCHGASGASYIYNYLYQITGNEDYKKSAIYWLNDTIERVDTIDFEGSGQLNDQLNDTYTILTGLSGVGLVLLASLENKKDSWSEILLLI